MKIVKRLSAFETNSSSTHSLVISDSCDTYEQPKGFDGKLVVRLGKFGWEQEEHYDLCTKLSYLFTDMCSLSGCDWKAPIEEYLENDRVKVVIDTLEEFTGLDVEIDEDYFFDESGHRDWYIDHESHGTAVYAVFDDGLTLNKDKLFKFLFCPGSHVITDNDNH